MVAANTGVHNNDVVPPDVKIIAVDGKIFRVHSAVLGSASPVLESLLFDRPKKHDKETEIPILGVPCGAVDAFLRCLYSSRWQAEEGAKEYDVHVLVLSHVLRVPWLKRAAEKSLAADLTAENVVDMLQLARQCDAARLYVRCMGLLRRDYKAVEKTEGWQFLQRNDPWLELEVLQFLQDAHQREKRRMRKRREQGVYVELSEAMESLRHICTEGCTCVGPRGEKVARQSPCKWGRTCEGVQRLIQHLAACEKKKRGGCGRCGSMWQLLRLHSAVCDHHGPCMVPLCKQFKERMGKGGEEEEKWSLLAKKVVSAKIMTSLCRKNGSDQIMRRSVGDGRLK